MHGCKKKATSKDKCNRFRIDDSISLNMFVPKVQAEMVPDEEIVMRVRAGETEPYEVLIRRYNQRLFRVTRSILRDDAEAEDVMQDAYVRAYEHLEGFASEAKFSTWLSKIAIYEALRRMRRRTKTEGLDSIMATATTHTPSPERQTYDQELRTC